jgi:hypothetical protein
MDGEDLLSLGFTEEIIHAVTTWSDYMVGPKTV